MPVPLRLPRRVPQNRFIRTPDGEPGLKRFFAHADERLRNIAARLAS